jgi:hypothetical protein
VFNALNRKTSVNSGFHLAAGESEVMLHHGAFPPSAVRNELSPLFTRYEDAKAHRRGDPQPATRTRSHS